MAVARRMRHNSDANRSTSSRSTAVTAVSAVNTSRTAFRRARRFASFGVRTVASECITSVGLDLSKRGHWLGQPSAVFAELPASMPRSRGMRRDSTAAQKRPAPSGHSSRVLPFASLRAPLQVECLSLVRCKNLTVRSAFVRSSFG